MFVSQFLAVVTSSNEEFQPRSAFYEIDLAYGCSSLKTLVVVHEVFSVGLGLSTTRLSTII